MDSEVLKQAANILSGVLKEKDPYEKIAVILKIIPVDSFEEAFRFFSADDQEQIMDFMETKTKVNSIETSMLVREFIKKNDLEIYLKTVTNHPEEVLSAFQKFAQKNPRKISQMLEDTWLK